MGDSINQKVVMTTRLDHFRVMPKHVQMPIENFIPDDTASLEVPIASHQSDFKLAREVDHTEIIKESLQAAHPTLFPAVCDTCAILTEFYLKAITDENRIMAQELMTSLISTLTNKYNYLGNRRDF